MNADRRAYACARCGADMDFHAEHAQVILQGVAQRLQAENVCTECLPSLRDWLEGNPDPRPTRRRGHGR